MKLEIPFFFIRINIFSISVLLYIFINCLGGSFNLEYLVPLPPNNMMQDKLFKLFIFYYIDLYNSKYFFAINLLSNLVLTTFKQLFKKNLLSFFVFCNIQFMPSLKSS